MKYPHLTELESRSIRVIREAYYEYREGLGILWSMGKDSTTLVHLARKSFLGTLPVPVIHLDTSFKFREIYEFRGRLAEKWRLNLIIGKNEPALRKGIYPGNDKFACCTALKTEALKQVISRYKLKALLVAIRRDEHSIRAKERYFSVRDEEFKWDYRGQSLELWSAYYKTDGKTGEHFRIHPLLHWREVDVWKYIRQERLPVVSLYVAKGYRRYRSIGCECCCLPVASSADTIAAIIDELERTTVPERAGRAQDKEKEFMMQKLRSLGYM
jgi:sulfate adenylyltransferase subunit 2